MTWKDDLRGGRCSSRSRCSWGCSGRVSSCSRRPCLPALERRVYLLATVGAFAAIDAGIIAFVLRGANALQLPFVDLLYGDLSPFANETRFGTAFMVTTLGLAVCAALVMVAWILDYHALRWPVVVLGAVLASGLALSGHQATEPNANWLTELADWVHLVAALFWVGGLVLLAGCVWPLAPAERRSAFLRFSRLAMVLVAAIVVAGTYLGIVRLPELSDLWTTSYGQILLLKIGIVSAALAWGGFHHMFVRPRLLRGDAPAGLRGSLLGESSLAMAVLLVAAILVNGSPPPVEPAGGTAQAATSGGSLPPPMPVAISGGAGFLGLHLARRLRAEGKPVRTLDVAALDDPGLDGEVEELHGDVRSEGDARRLVAGADVVVHAAAALPHPDLEGRHSLRQRRRDGDVAGGLRRGRVAAGRADLLHRLSTASRSGVRSWKTIRSSASEPAGSRRSMPAARPPRSAVVGWRS